MTPRSLRFTRGDRATAWGLLAPGTLWLVLFFAVPILIMAGYSVMERGTYGGVESGFTLEAYARFFDPLYLRILARTLMLAAVTTLLCLAVGYPMAYAIAAAGRWKHALLFLVVLPFWTSFLVRTYAIMFLLRDTGLVNSVLMGIGLTDAPLTLLYTPGAVLAGLVYGYLPFMVLPLYASLEKIDPKLVEAGKDLYANGFTSFRKITLPLSMPGVVAGTLLTFIPAVGDFINAELLGGPGQRMIGNVIQSKFLALIDYPSAAALSFVLMALIVAAIAVYARIVGSERLT